MTNNKQQTAVEWQFDQLSSENLLGIFTHEQMTRVMEILEQAKEMEKEQIMQAHYAPKYGCFTEDYYEQTYGGNK
jgi:ABC-type uncharacterized transport system substrate-binding protein